MAPLSRMEADHSTVIYIFMGLSSVSHQHEGDPKSAVLSLKYGGLLIKSTASHYKRRKVNSKKVITVLNISKLKI